MQNKGQGCVQDYSHRKKKKKDLVNDKTTLKTCGLYFRFKAHFAARESLSPLSLDAFIHCSEVFVGKVSGLCRQ